MEIKNPVGAILICCVFIVIGIGIAADGLIRTQKGQDSLDWPFVSGQILTARIQEAPSDEGTDYIPRVSYTYQVGDTVYAGERITFRGNAGSEAEAQAVLQRYPVGRTVRVYYNPNRLAEAVLEPGPCTSCFGIVAFGTVFGLVGAYALAEFLRRRSESQAAPARMPERPLVPCPHCGKQIPADALDCSYCGWEVAGMLR